VSALGWQGPERRVYEFCRAGDLRQSTTPDLLAELERVLRYPKFHFTEFEIRSFLRDLAACAKVVIPAERISVIQQDPDDNRVLECAVECQADWIVSGDPHLLELGEYRGIQILSAAAALRRSPT
jgi:putative PIN family toxin of toxin-antitoxin system